MRKLKHQWFLVRLTWLIFSVLLAQYGLAKESVPPCIRLDGEVTSSSRHVLYGLPVPVKAKARYSCLENTGYAVGYSETMKDPLWAAYRVWHVENAQAFKRPNRFRVDVRTQARVRHEEYKQDEPRLYDRGHMAPSFIIGSRYGREAQIETFLMSNVVPQRKELNEQTWRALEELIESHWTVTHGELYVIVGPIFTQSPRRLNGVAAIPKSFYAIVVDTTGGNFTSMAVIIPQEVKGSLKLRRFITTIDEIERVTGLDFFSELPDGIENLVEAKKAGKDWDIDLDLVPKKIPNNNKTLH